MKYYFSLFFILFALLIIPSCQMTPTPVYPKDYQDGYDFGENLAKMDSMECLSSGLFGNNSLIIDLLEKKHRNELDSKKSKVFMQGFKKSYRYFIEIYYPAYCKD